MKKIAISLLLIVASFGSSAQLDPLYNQYQFNQLMINSAYAGIYNRFSASLITRLNWVGIEGAPVTNTVTVQSALREGTIGLGALIVDDRLGVNRNLETSLAASYNIKINDAKLAMGLQGGFINYGFDLTLLTLDYVDDERLSLDLLNNTEPNFGTGFMYMTPTFYAGFSVPRIRTLKLDDGISNSSRYKRHYYASAGYFYDASEYMQYKATTLLRYIEGAGMSYDFTFSTFIDRVVWSGVTIRDLKYFGLFFSLEMAKNMRVGYAFELPTNSLIIGTYGTHEISISIDTSLRKTRTLSQRRF